jgi:hypothetical protein
MISKNTQILHLINPLTPELNPSAQGRSLPMGQPGQSEQLAPTPHIKICNKKAKLCNIVTATSLLN